MTFLVILDCCLIAVLAGFNGWNWMLATQGRTTIEFWKRQALYDYEDVYDFAYDDMRDNLFTIFGTHKLLRILSPSLRPVPFNGIEFSFLLRDLGYDERGEKDWREKCRGDLEMAHIP